MHLEARGENPDAVVAGRVGGERDRRDARELVTATAHLVVASAFSVCPSASVRWRSMLVHARIGESGVRSSCDRWRGRRPSPGSPLLPSPWLLARAPRGGRAPPRARDA